jgi:3-phosphoshikimate 1-carboxyvinyltransferase
MKQKVSPSRALAGEVRPPGDKSISHRAVILNGIAEGKARLTNFSPGADCLSTLACMRALGVEIAGDLSGAAPSLSIHGAGGRGLREAVDVLNAGNSGTTMRLLAGLLAAQPFLSIITGDQSLRSRPMGRIVEPLRLMGASIWGRGNDSLAPLAIRGQRLHGIEYRLPVASAQVKSALLLAGLFAEDNTTVEEPAPSRDHTERLLQEMGASLHREGRHTRVSPLTGPLKALDMRIPGDISSAAYWLVAGATHPDARIRIKDVGLNPTRSGIIDVLEAMGADIKVENRRVEGGEPVADLEVSSSSLRGIEVSGEMIPRVIDEIPVIAVAASLATGTTMIRDAAELRVKESDRISTTAEELSKMGARIEALPDGMIVHGVGRLVGANCHSHDDHRLAMTIAVAALGAQGDTVIDSAEAVDISYPSFWSDLDRLSAP